MGGPGGKVYMPAIYISQIVAVQAKNCQLRSSMGKMEYIETIKSFQHVACMQYAAYRHAAERTSEVQHFIL